MIITKTIKVKNHIRYKKLGYESDEKYILIDIKDLTKGSNVEIDVKCDYCEKERSISYKQYNINISTGGKYACSIKCGILKSNESNLEKYGTEHFFQSNYFREKSKEVIKEKYGVDHISQLDSVRKSKSDKMKSYDVSDRVIKYYENLTDEDFKRINDKRIITNRKKYGVDNISQLDFIKDKKAQKGYSFERKDIVERIRNTNLEKYGTEFPSQNENIKEKVKETNLERYGVEYYSQTEESKNRIKETNLKKYGVDNIMLSKEFRDKFNISNELGFINYLGNRLYEFKCLECNNIYDIDYDNYYKRILRKVNPCTICNPISDQKSIKEKDLFNYISSIYDDEIIENYRDGLEIDIYLPKLNIGFEFNGIYWHSDERLDNNYHLNKTNYFKEKNIRIIHIWEDDWDNNRDIIKSQITYLLNKCDNRIYARKCEIREVSGEIAKRFLENNHIQGFIRSNIKIGLYYDNELVSLMTFDQFEGRKKMNESEWNLSRFCSKINTNVIGSASKLLKYFIKTYNPKRVISFADKDWSDGDLYYLLGFELKYELNPDYKYVYNHKRINKQRFTKKKLVEMGYDVKLTESQIMKELNIPKIYNVGQMKFELFL